MKNGACAGKSSNRGGFSEEAIPYFAWDRRWTVSEIRRRLNDEAGTRWARIAAWILREAAFEDVWRFLTPQEVYERFAEIEPFLGRRRAFWRYILKTWHELGKL